MVRGPQTATQKCLESTHMFEALVVILHTRHSHRTVQIAPKYGGLDFCGEQLRWIEYLVPRAPASAPAASSKHTWARSSFLVLAVVSPRSILKGTRHCCLVLYDIFRFFFAQGSSSRFHFLQVYGCAIRWKNTPRDRLLPSPCLRSYFHRNIWTI